MAADPEVEAWLRLRFRTWKREQPAWFTEVLQSCIPTDMLPPRDAKRLESQAQAHGVRRRTTIHDADASLVQRLSLSLGVQAPPAAHTAVGPSQIVPVGEPEDSRAESSDSEAELQLEPAPEPGDVAFRTRHSRRWASIEWSTSGNTSHCQSLRPGLLRQTLPLRG
jgi:hypothetical protein